MQIVLLCAITKYKLQKTVGERHFLFVCQLALYATQCEGATTTTTTQQTNNTTRGRTVKIKKGLRTIKSIGLGTRWSKLIQAHVHPCRFL